MTALPIPLGLAASFDDGLVNEMGAQIRGEMVAVGQKMAKALFAKKC